MVSSFNWWFIVIPALLALELIVGLLLGFLEIQKRSYANTVAQLVVFTATLVNALGTGIVFVILVTRESFAGAVEFFGRDEWLSPIFAAGTILALGFILIFSQVWVSSVGEALIIALHDELEKTKDCREVLWRNFRQAGRELTNEYGRTLNRVATRVAAEVRGRRIVVRTKVEGKNLKVRRRDVVLVRRQTKVSMGDLKEAYRQAEEFDLKTVLLWSPSYWVISTNRGFSVEVPDGYRIRQRLQTLGLTESK